MLDRLTRRLKKLGIEIELLGNFPWVYLHKVNGKLVTEKFRAEHGFTIMFQTNNKPTDLRETFKVIRKYI